MEVLNVENLTIRFGGLTAVSNVSLHADEGELIGLIGPNGAGKTTTFNMLTGVYTPTEGKITFTNKQGQTKVLNGKKPYKVAQEGISRTFQNIRLFKEATVMDNVRLAMHKNIQYSVFSAVMKFPKYVKEEETMRSQALEILEFVGLKDKAEEYAMNLPYGEQRKLEIARAVATQANVIFLDEPAAGMNPIETEELSNLVRRLKKDYNLTIILIEHDMKFVMNLCERIYVLDFGQLIAEGTPEEIKNNKRVIEAYLGEEV